MPSIDPHSYTDSTQPFTTHTSLSLYLDFDTTTVLSSALLSLSGPFSGDLTLDTRSLTIFSAVDPKTLSPLPFSLQSPDPILGQCLTVTLSNHSQLLLRSKTSPSATALQWLSPQQTAIKKNPYIYTQCQAIHARSIFPCQDTPAARIKYSAKLNIPSKLSAVMSAKRLRRREPLPDECNGACDDSIWCGEERVVEEFEMDKPIPPYLFAFAVGELGSEYSGPRTDVHSENVQSMLDLYAKEFTGTEDMINIGVDLFGPYEWGRFDLLVLPPSFPFGGMENPTMVFLTPTVVKGDCSGAQVVAHELAHSWTGNLVTNKNNEHFWLNEGFTIYAERRITEASQGKKKADLNNAIGWIALQQALDDFTEKPEFTKLYNHEKGVDPDAIYSQIPYEKGFQFLWRIEREIGRPAFDVFLKSYINHFMFQSIDTETMLAYLKEQVPGIEKTIDLKEWTEGPGLPPDAKKPVSEIYIKIQDLAAQLAKNGKIPDKDEVSDWAGQEWQLYIQSLPKKIEASQASVLDDPYQLSKSKDYDVKVAFLKLVTASRITKYYDDVEVVLKSVGRIKYLRPLYMALVVGKNNELEKDFAKRVYAEAKDSYHPIAQGVVEGILKENP